MKESNNLCNVRDCMLCTLCMHDWIPAVKGSKRNFSVRKGESLFREGEPVAGIYFVYSGTFKVHKRWDQEKELILRFAAKGDILGHLGLGEDRNYSISATALEPAIVCFVTIPFFESSVRVNTDLTYHLMRFFANELQNSQKRMRDLAHMSVKARIAQSLVSMKEQFGTNEQGFINLEITRQDLASFAGTTYETLFKVANELIQKQAIELHGKKIMIREEASLHKIIDEDNL